MESKNEKLGIQNTEIAEWIELQYIFASETGLCSDKF